ncbi:malate dehydrogenase (quinone) [Psychromonas antarctica]|jgi:malate dehydrogenase (quinone)|uniref:malate dehydrogenase (quinone) n=1 Tax=Psychromonas antarctica TaxID=67573 RepID=UPI001EE8E6C6|nr:malate dehydrogenase (quinone) [Psychromonas antarctica]MCG6201506.1 malate dehydrogenase (quinone) [Psychromonas antarctica]
MNKNTLNEKEVDILLVGAGIMSTTLAMLLRQLDPSLKIAMIERLSDVASESSDGWNNAGTGHAAYCELNYTPEHPDGSIDTTKAFSINTAFEESLQFWSYLVDQKILASPHFINQAPHHSFVSGDKDVNFLRKRYQLLSAHPLFADMQYSEDPEQLKKWIPLVMAGREPTQKVAGSRVRYGSDVNFGALTRDMLTALQKMGNFEILVQHCVTDIDQQADKRWRIRAKNKMDGPHSYFNARFVFLGAGGGSLALLQASGIPESKGYGGFPISGQWLACTVPEVVGKHHAKVYGKAPKGAPPMSVPHLDTRIIDGKKTLLFGPFAGFTTKFLKQGSPWDLATSINPTNLLPMLSVGTQSIDLIRYLISEMLQSHKSRMRALQCFYPEAKPADWFLSVAGQRVQIIKKGADKAGKLELGTEIIHAADGTLAALLGASPGASTAVHTMLGVIETCFAKELKTETWQVGLKKIIPSYGQSLVDNRDLLVTVREHTLASLGLDQKPL